MSSGNKRASKRSHCRLQVRFGTTEIDRIAFTRDISETGLYLQTTRTVAPGTLLRLEVQLREGTLVLQGRVAWAKAVPVQLARVARGGMGVQGA